MTLSLSIRGNAIQNLADKTTAGKRQQKTLQNAYILTPT